jgi:protein-histidine pros-kinase
MSLRVKFNLVMLVTFLAGWALAGVFAYQLAFSAARREVMNQAAIMSGQAKALSEFTVKEIAPLLVGQFNQRFLPQSVPAWVSQTNFRAMQADFPDHSFRVVVENPTNPADAPADWQGDIIKNFKGQSSLKEVVIERDTPNGRILSVAQPVIITNPACLQCHSTPAAAPATMIDLYGPNNGFGWKLNEVLGARIVSVPMSLPFAEANRTFFKLMSGLGAVFLVMIVLLNLLLHYVIIRPVRVISEQAVAVSMGNMDAPEVLVKTRDEIGLLAESFNRMRRSLANAMKLLNT